MLATFESAGMRASRSLRPTTCSSDPVRRHVELDDLHLALGEHVGLSGRREADVRGDRLRRLELRGDHEVDVDLRARARRPGTRRSSCARSSALQRSA